MARDGNETHCRRFDNRNDGCRFLDSNVCDYMTVPFRLFLFYRDDLLFDCNDLGEGGGAEVGGEGVAEV